MNYTQKMGRRLATLILCLCMLLALFPTTALASSGNSYSGLIIARYSDTDTLDVKRGSCNSDYWFRYYNWALTEKDGTSAANSTKTYSGKMILGKRGEATSVRSYTGSSNITEVSFSNGSATADAASGKSITWTFTGATLDDLEGLISCAWVQSSGNQNPGGATQGYGSLVITFEDLTEGSGHTITVTTNSSGEAAGSGSVQFVDSSNTTYTTISGSAAAAEGEVTLKFVPDTDCYVSGYTITYADGTVEASKEKLTGNEDKTYTIASLTQDVTVEPVFTRVETQDQVEGAANRQTSRSQGSLAWKTTVTEGSYISYKDALELNYNATVNNYLLDSRYGKSWTYGVDPLANPAMYMYAAFDSKGTTPVVVQDGTKDTKKDLGQGTSTTAETNQLLKSSIKASDVKPGVFTQTVEADYYNAKTVCRNHWYHVYGVTYHKDGMNRSFTILKDTLTLSGVESSYAYKSGLYDTITKAATLTPAAYTTSGTQNKETLTRTTAGVTITIYDSGDNRVTSIDAAGTYKLVAIYTGNDYIASYTEGATKDANNNQYAALTAKFTVTLGDYPDTATVTTPTVAGATTTTITLDSSSIVDGQEYSIDGTTWYAADKLKAMNYTFSGLTQGTKYTVQTRLPATNQYNAKYGTSAAASTLVTVSGTVTAGGTADITKPVTVTFTDTATGKTYTAEADDNGSYSLDLPLGTYTVTVTDKDGLQSATATFTVSSASTNALNVTMKNTAKGAAMVSIDTDAKAAKEEIDKMDGLTEEEKTAKKAEIDQAAANAKTAVKAAADDAGVATALSDFSTALNLIKEKAEALASISSGTAAQTAQAAKDAINALTNLTDEEKKAKIAEIDQALADAKTAVGKAADDAAVQAALAALENSVTLIQSKATAIDGINKDAADAKAAIDKLENLTDAEKTAKKAEIDTAAKTAKDAVDAAADADGITDAAKQLAGDLTLIQSKAEAIDDINKKAAAKKAELDQAVTDGTLSQDDADALKAIIDEAADKAKDAVNKATDQDGIDDALEQFDEDLALIDKKIAAAKQINEDAADAKAAIDKLENLTDAQKQAKKDEIDKAAQDAKDAVNAAITEDEINEALDQLAEDLKDIRDHAIAEDFVAGYFTDEDGNIFTDFDSSNIDQILGAQDAYDALTDDQKAIVDELLSQATGGKYSSYAEYAAGAQKAAEESAADFIKAHMTLNGKTIIAVTKDTYDSIVGGAEDWSKLSQAEKDAVNAQLKAAGATQTYEEMLAAVEKAVDESSDDFIAKYLTNELGDIYTEATFGNYQQILSGLTDWNNMTQAERDAVNAKLMKAIGKTYEILLAEAQELERVMALLAVPDTGDDGSLTLLYVLMLVGAAGLTGTYVCGKRKKYGK